MKVLPLVSLATVCLASLACSTAADPPPANETAGTSSGGANENGGSTPGATGGSGNTANTAGNTSTAGTSAGGALGTAGTLGESGGTTNESGGAGATTSSGAGTGGTTSETGGAGGSAPVVDTTLAGTWDGALIEYACGNTGSGYDCQQPTTAQCTSVIGTDKPPSVLKPSNGAATSWTMGGTAGTIYAVTVHIRGVVEVNWYKGGTRDEGTTSILKNGDLFQQGGTPQVNGDPSFDYNTYELDVTPAVSGAANTYFLNSVTQNENPHANSSPTTHLTFPIDYTKTIQVPGGGTVKLTVTDSNCTEVQNCGPTSGNTCAAPRTVSLAGSTPAAPTQFVQPYQQPAGRYGQWLYFDITNVAVAQ